MTPTPPSVQPQAQLSPDGRWSWDGQQWNPVAGFAPPSPPRKKSHKARNLLGIVALALIAIVVIAVATTAAHGGGAANTGPRVTKMANGDMTVTANNVTLEVGPPVYDIKSDNEFIQPEPGNVFVGIAVGAKNNGDSEFNFNPANFVLKDGTGVKHSMAILSPTYSWQAVNLTKGASAAKPLAFEAAANHPTGLTLVWTPDFITGDVNIRLN